MITPGKPGAVQFIACAKMNRPQLVLTIMPITPLDRLLFAQGGLCFFCNAPLPKANASIEHLNARANGGANDDENCVACCKAINFLLGSMTIKDKIRVILNQKGKFVCPNRPVPAAASIATPSSVGAAGIDVYSIVLADLEKRGLSRPKRVVSLKNTIRAVVETTKDSLTEPQLDSLLKRLQDNGKIQISGNNVSYSP